MFFPGSTQALGYPHPRHLGTPNINARVSYPVPPPASCSWPGQAYGYSRPGQGADTGRRSSHLAGQGCYSAGGPPAGSRGLLFPVFSCSEKDGRLTPRSRPSWSERFFKKSSRSKCYALQAISPGDWFTSIDLKDTYFHVPIARPHWRFLRFAFQGQHYQFRVLPFGLSLSPRVFSRCIAAALSPLQARGLKIMPYLDDWLICVPSREDVIRDMQTVLDHAASLGLRVNVEKSNLAPSQLTTFLGMVLDSRSMTACPSPRRVQDILSMLPQFQHGRTLPYVLYLRLLGKLVAASTVVSLGLLTLRPFQMWLNGLNLNPEWHVHRCKRLHVSPQCLKSLSPWRNGDFITQGVPLGSVPARREVVNTDASLRGWGATWQGRMVQGTWLPWQQRLHINVLELMAVRLALRHFLPHLRDRHVLVRSDNTCVVFHINHHGGTRSVELVGLTTQILTWAAPRLASLRAMHIPGALNVSADFMSRQLPRPGEWRLHPEVVLLLWRIY